MGRQNITSSIDKNDIVSNFRFSPLKVEDLRKATFATSSRSDALLGVFLRAVYTEYVPKVSGKTAYTSFAEIISYEELDDFSLTIIACLFLCLSDC